MFARNQTFKFLLIELVQFPGSGDHFYRSVRRICRSKSRQSQLGSCLGSILRRSEATADASTEQIARLTAAFNMMDRSLNIGFRSNSKGILTRISRR